MRASSPRGRRVLDLDDLRAQVGEEHHAERPGAELRGGEDAEPVERRAHRRSQRRLLARSTPTVPAIGRRQQHRAGNPVAVVRPYPAGWRSARRLLHRDAVTRRMLRRTTLALLAVFSIGLAAYARADTLPGSSRAHEALALCDAATRETDRQVSAHPARPGPRHRRGGGRGGRRGCGRPLRRLLQSGPSACSFVRSVS